MMRNKIFSTVFVAASLCNVFASLTASIHSEARKTFYVGEQAYVPVYIEETNAMTDELNGGTGANGYVISHVSGNASWLKYNHRPDYADGTELNTSDPGDHWYNNQVIWLEMAGLATTAGDYSGTLLVQNTLTGESQNLNYSFSVVDPPPALYVVSQDAAASYGRQIEQYSYILNKTGSSVTLNRPYMDYYMTKTPDKQLILNIWSRPHNTCVQVLDCGSNHYVIRQRYTGSLELGANVRTKEFQLGMNEHSNGYNSSYFDFLPEKAIRVFSNPNYGFITLPDGSYSNAYLDYSYAGFATNYVAKAMRRNKYFNPTMTLRDISGTTYYGVAPDWFVEGQCQNATITTSSALNANVIRTYDEGPFCSDEIPAISFTTPEDTIYEGEDYYAMPVVTSGNGEIVSLEITDMSGYDWLESGTPADYWDDYANVIGSLGVSGYAKMFYVRSRHGFVRQNYNLDPGVYTYTLRATDAAGQVATVTRTVRIIDGLNYAADKNLGSGVVSNHGMAVLMGDETWFKSYQLDIATGIENFANSGSYTFENGFYYDYYGQFDKGFITSSMNHPHDWYLNPGFTETFYDCGNNRFRIRYTYQSGNGFWISHNHSKLDMKSGIVYNTGSRMNKADDYSMQDFVKNGVLELRGRRYNPHMPLYDGNGTRLWGEAPAWANQCVEYNASSSSSYIPPSSSSYSSSSSYTPPQPQSSSSSYPRSSSSKPVLVARLSSSSSFNAFRDLAVRSKIMSTSNSDVNIAIDFINNGNAVAQVGGYTARYYYSDEFVPNDAVLQYFKNDIPDEIISSVTEKQCDEHLFALDFKINQSVSISPNSVVPNGGLSWRFQQQPDDSFSPSKLGGSWFDVSEMTENGKIALFDAQGRPVAGIEAWPCDGYTKKTLKLAVRGFIHPDGRATQKLYYVPNAVAVGKLQIENWSDSVVAGPVYVDFHVTHTPGAVPVIIFGGKTLATAGGSIADNDVLVTHISAGNLHTFRFTLLNGIQAGQSRSPYIKTIEFELSDQCINGCKELLETTSYQWNLGDDWSAYGIIGYSLKKTDNVPVYNSEGDKLIGTPDPSAPVYAVKQQVNGPDNGEKEVLKHSRAMINAMVPNRTDAVAYSGGQLLSGGDFESQWVQGWDVYEPDTLHVVKSVRGRTPQGSRYLSMNGGTSISQVLNSAAAQILADSGAVLTVWHKNASNTASIKLNNVEIKVLGTSSKWIVDTIPIPSSSFNQLKDDTLSIYAYGIDSLRLDDIILVPNSKAQPTTYATRFTNTSGEELETRAYDGDKEQLVTTSQRDAMGRLSKKYLPFEMDCKSVEECNSDLKTLNNPGAAVSKYTAANPDYPDAGNMPYVETHWKPDPMATKDVESAPGAPFSLDSTHIVRAFSSGVNMSGINWLDSASLDSAVSLDSNARNYEDKYTRNSLKSYLSKNYHAKKDSDPTHLWELNVDQDGRRTFTVKDGEGHVIVSGVLDSTGKLQSRSVNEFDERGNIIKSHSPISCGYTNPKSTCVDPSEYEYDTESRVIKSIEPDAGITLTYYDYAGRVRATQTQNQIHKGKATVSGYDDLGRVIYTGEWDVVVLSDLRSFFMNPFTPDDKKRPYAEELTPGTVTRTFYDKAPSQDSLDALGVKILPDGETLEYTRGRVAVVISDVKAVLDDNGNPVLTAAGKDSVIRVSTANSYDKYGRVVATYTYDPTMPSADLTMMAVKNTYDVGGKLTSSTKYPYGAGRARSVTERYNYDRLGRVQSIEVQKDGSKFAELASYSYYPTGSVKSVLLGGNISIDYTYHISGAVASAVVKRADGSNLFNETLFYEDCGGDGCKPQYNGNISRMTHELVTQSRIPQTRDSRYYYDFMNRLTQVDDVDMMFDEAISYDNQGRITSLRRSAHAENTTGGEYTYENRKNRLLSVAQGIGGGDFKFLGDASKDVDRDMSDPANFDYDSEGNLIEDKSKRMKISYDWRGMPVEFKLQNTENSSDSTRLTMMYDGSGRRVAKTRARKAAGATEWETELVTHYTGIGTEVRDQFHNNILDKVKVVVNMPQGLGRYGVEENSDSYVALGENDDPNAVFEWYLKNHLGSTMLVYGTQSVSQVGMADFGLEKAAYDYRAFGEQMSIVEPADKVTENFTGKELDDEIALNYFGARYLDPMLGLWISVDPARQFSSPYLYAGNGVNPVNVIDPDGNATWSLGINGSANAWLVGVSGSMSVKLNTNPKNFGDVIHFGIATRAGLACAKGASSRVRVGYSPDGPSSGLNHAIVNSMTVPIWLKPPVVLGISEATDINTDNKTYTVEAGVGLEGGLDAVHAETSFDFSLGDAFDALIKFKDYMVNSAKDYMTNVNDRAKDIMENPESYAP